MLVKTSDFPQKSWGSRLFAVLFLAVIAGPASAQTSEASGRIGFMANLPVWTQIAFVVFCWWLLAVVLSMLAWKPLNDAPKAARISAGFAAACALVFVHLYVFAFSLVYAIAVGALFVIVCLVLWYSYSTARR